MILISSSLPKSASTLIADYQEVLLDLSHERSGQSILRERFGGRYIHRLSPRNLLRLMIIHARHGSVVVKTHAAPNLLVRLLIRTGLARATVCYRDPRDVLLSAIDHGERSRQAGSSGSFVDLEDVAGSIARVREWLRLVDRWERFGRAHFIRYEDLVEDHRRELRRMVEYLGWKISDRDLERVVRQKETVKGASPNFNTGRSQRYRVEMSPEDNRLCVAAFGPFLDRHGYESEDL